MNSPTNVSKFDNDFIISSELAFSFIKNKLNKESVTCGDTLLELFNFSENNTELLESLFNLSLLMLFNTRGSIGEENYQKLLQYTIEQYQNKL